MCNVNIRRRPLFADLQEGPIDVDTDEKGREVAPAAPESQPAVGWRSLSDHAGKHLRNLHRHVDLAAFALDRQGGSLARLVDLRPQLFHRRDFGRAGADAQIARLHAGLGRRPCRFVDDKPTFPDAFCSLGDNGRTATPGLPLGSLASASALATLPSSSASEFRHLEHFYFHNCVYDHVWRDNARRRNERMGTLELLRTYGADWKVIFVGDAAMSPYELVQAGGSVETRFGTEPRAMPRCSI